MKEPLKIEVGKRYRCRNGMEARIYATDCGIVYPIHGAWKSDEGWHSVSWTRSGNVCPESDFHESQWDIISEWIEKPQMDRSLLPAWANKAVAMDESGSWYSYPTPPSWDTSLKLWTWWIMSRDFRPANPVFIPPSHAPKWSGKPEDSLIVFED